MRRPAGSSVVRYFVLPALAAAVTLYIVNPRFTNIMRRHWRHAVSVSTDTPDAKPTPLRRSVQPTSSPIQASQYPPMMQPSAVPPPSPPATEAPVDAQDAADQADEKQMAEDRSEEFRKERDEMQRRALEEGTQPDAAPETQSPAAEAPASPDSG